MRILLADDHVLLREGLKRILEARPDFEIVAETGSGAEAIDLAARHRPDVAVVDVVMKDLNGIEAAARIRERSPETAVLILSMHKDERYVTRSVRAGARGYLLKDDVEGELLAAIQAVHEGGSFFSPAVARFARPA